MSTRFRTGKRAALPDHRAPRFSHKIDVGALAPPPAFSNWYAKVPEWAMLMNDSLGDCVEAAILHLLYQMSLYADDPLIPTDADALAFYQQATGYSPLVPGSDQGSYVMGPTGVMQYWTNTGVTIGSRPLNKVGAFLQITKKDPNEWRQAISLFGNLLTGMQLPKVIVPDDGDPPDVWADYSGSVDGGHEVLINGYETLANGQVEYTFVSWGRLYRATEEFLLNVVDETVTVYDDVMFNADGVDGAGISRAQLVADMATFRAAA